MLKLFDASFLGGTGLALLTIGFAWAAVTRTELPVLGSGAGLLLAIGAVGLASCAIGGIGTVTEFDLTQPRILVGTALGILAFAIVVAGLLGWTAPFQPLVQLVPGEAASVSAVQLASLALAGLIAAKWVIATILTIVTPAAPATPAI
jgi:hypothetical protein